MVAAATTNQCDFQTNHHSLVCLWLYDGEMNPYIENRFTDRIAEVCEETERHVLFADFTRSGPSPSQKSTKISFSSFKQSFTANVNNLKRR